MIDHLNSIDLILIMSVEPGFGGQKFLPEVLPKLEELKNIISKKKFQYRFRNRWWNKF